MFAGRVLCAGGHGHRKSFLNAVLNVCRLHALIGDMVCWSVAIAIINIFLAGFLSVCRVYLS